MASTGMVLGAVWAGVGTIVLAAGMAWPDTRGTNRDEDAKALREVRDEDLWRATAYSMRDDPAEGDQAVARIYKVHERARRDYEGAFWLVIAERVYRVAMDRKPPWASRSGTISTALAAVMKVRSCRR